MGGLGALLPPTSNGAAFARQFTTGLHTAMIVAAVIAVAGAALAATLLPSGPDRACSTPSQPTLPSREP